ncbi:hypothetical protein [Streptomyces sp. NPDC000133]|uniref:hypothetical protein n=1 Tax=Streptomyces sp. NPDC000133 TaxID=3364535 RepID=UPI0036B34921
MTCAHCGRPFAGTSSRRDRIYCGNSCRALASYYRRKASLPCPPRWRHPAFESDNPLLRTAALHAQALGETHGWSTSTVHCTLDGLAILLADRLDGERVPFTEIRRRTSRHTSGPRVAEVLTDLGLLDDDSTASVRSWIDCRTGELPNGFAADVRAWLLVLLDGDPRARPRSAGSIYLYFGVVRPFLESWSATRECLREITPTDVTAALEALRGWSRHNAVAALRSLFRFAKKRRLVFTDPTTRLKSAGIEPALLPLTDAEIDTISQSIITPAQRLVVALAAVHAARACGIRSLMVDDVDLPNGRITIAGHEQRLGELPAQTLTNWFDLRKVLWPRTPNRHVLINKQSCLGTGPVSRGYFHGHLLPPGIRIDRIRSDCILHEALTSGPDPLDLSLLFNLSHTTASRYAALARLVS